MNLTSTEAEAPGFLRVTPTGAAPADTSNVNFFAGDTVPNLVICKLGSGGKVTVDGAGSAKHLLGDVFGYFTSNGDRLRAKPPRRVLDTRIGVGSPQRPITPTEPITLAIAGSGAAPGDATAVVLNVAATNVTAHSFMTVYPAGEPRPDTSNLNLAPGQTIANLVICRLGEGGALTLANPIGACDAIADVLGYFTA